MLKDISKAVYWIFVVLIALFIVSLIISLVAFGVDIIFGVVGIFLAVIFAPMLLTKAAASDAEIEAPKTEVKSDTSNAAKFYMMK
ncbi:hypothetical protein CPL00172_CDS0043 [Escherichia phage BubbaBully]